MYYCWAIQYCGLTQRSGLGVLGVPLPPKVVVCLPWCHGTFVPYEIVMVGRDCSHVQTHSCQFSRPELAASRSCITFDLSSFKLVTSDLFPVDFWDVPKSFSLFLRIGAVHGIFLSLGGSMRVAQKSSYCWGTK